MHPAAAGMMRSQAACDKTAASQHSSRGGLTSRLAPHRFCTTHVMPYQQRASQLPIRMTHHLGACCCMCAYAGKATRVCLPQAHLKEGSTPRICGWLPRACLAGGRGQALHGADGPQLPAVQEQHRGRRSLQAACASRTSLLAVARHQHCKCSAASEYTACARAGHRAGLH